MISNQFQLLFIFLYPYKWFFLYVWLACFKFANVPTMKDDQFFLNLIATAYAWTFFSWAVIFLYGRPERPEYRKTHSFFIVVYGSGVVLGVFSLPFITIWGFYSICLRIISS